MNGDENPSHSEIPNSLETSNRKVEEENIVNSSLEDVNLESESEGEDDEEEDGEDLLGSDIDQEKEQEEENEPESALHNDLEKMVQHSQSKNIEFDRKELTDRNTNEQTIIPKSNNSLFTSVENKDISKLLGIPKKTKLLSERRMEILNAEYNKDLNIEHVDRCIFPCPLRIRSDTYILSFGKIYPMDNEKSLSKRKFLEYQRKFVRKRKDVFIHPYPVGFTVQTQLANYTVILKVDQDENGPKFYLYSNDRKFSGTLPTTPITSWLKLCNMPSNKSGTECFGFELEIVQKLINQLPNAEEFMENVTKKRKKKKKDTDSQKSKSEKEGSKATKKEEEIEESGKDEKNDTEENKESKETNKNEKKNDLVEGKGKRKRDLDEKPKRKRRPVIKTSNSITNYFHRQHPIIHPNLIPNTIPNVNTSSSNVDNSSTSNANNTYTLTVHPIVNANMNPPNNDNSAPRNEKNPYLYETI